ncbi:MAG: septum formation initiator family protein [Candidatus Nealsonbacteria bacterium]
MVAKSSKTKKGSKEHWFFSALIGVLMLVIVGFLLVSNLKMLQKSSELNRQKDALFEQVKELEAKREQLQVQISQTGEEEYLEKEARETFNLKKPGEEVVAVLPAEEGIQSEAEKSFWQKFLEKIGF